MNMKKGASSIDLSSIAGLAFPLLLILIGSKGSSTMNFKVDKDFESKSELIENIKPYFSFKEQSTLNKIQDVIEIVNKVNKIQNSDYQGDSRALTTEMAIGDKRERILAELSKQLEGKSKDVAESLIETRQRMKETQNNLMRHKDTVKGQEDSKTDEMVNLIKSLEPILPDKGKKRVRKLENILSLVRRPDDEF